MGKQNTKKVESAFKKLFSSHAYSNSLFQLATSGV